MVKNPHCLFLNFLCFFLHRGLTSVKEEEKYAPYPSWFKNNEIMMQVISVLAFLNVILGQLNNTHINCQTRGHLLFQGYVQSL